MLALCRGQTDQACSIAVLRRSLHIPKGWSLAGSGAEGEPCRGRWVTSEASYLARRLAPYPAKGPFRAQRVPEPVDVLQ